MQIRIASWKELDGLPSEFGDMKIQVRHQSGLQTPCEFGVARKEIETAHGAGPSELQTSAKDVRLRLPAED